MTGKLLKLYLIFACLCLCVLQSPTARRCGWWCLWCACRWWLSPSSSLSSSAPWDTTAACRAPRVRDGVTPASARQSTHCHCSFHDIITNLSLRQLCKRGGADLRRVFAQIMQSVPLFLSAHESKQSLHTHKPAYLFLMKQTLTAWWWLILTFLQYLSVHHLFQLFTGCSSVLLHSFWIIIWKYYSLLSNKLTQVELYWIGVTGRCVFIAGCQF